MNPLARRRLVLRALGVILVATWAVFAVVATLGWRSGGPLDVAVLVLACMPALLAVAAVAWPPSARHERAAMALIWLGIGAVLVSAPVVAGEVSDLAANMALDAVPSPEASYALALAVTLTAVFGLLGSVQRRRAVASLSRATVVRSVSLALTATVALTVSYRGLAGVAADARTSRAATSPFGPTQPDAWPPGCSTLPLLGATARLAMTGRGEADGRGMGTASLAGVRAGLDERWESGARRASERSAGPSVDARSETDRQDAPGPRDGATGPLADMDMGVEYVRVAEDAWLRASLADDGTLPAPVSDTDSGAWVAVDPDPFGLFGEDGLTVDGPVLAFIAGPTPVISPATGSRPAPAVTPAPGIAGVVVEDRGVEVIEGAPGRHCAAYLDGPMALDTFVVLRWLLPDVGGSEAPRLDAWRGELDWWVFGDGALGRAIVRIGGFAGDAWEASGQQGRLEAEMVAIDRGAPVSVVPVTGTLESAQP